MEVAAPDMYRVATVATGCLPANRKTFVPALWIAAAVDDLAAAALATSRVNLPVN